MDIKIILAIFLVRVTECLLCCQTNTRHWSAEACTATCVGETCLKVFNRTSDEIHSMSCSTSHMGDACFETERGVYHCACNSDLCNTHFPYAVIANDVSVACENEPETITYNSSVLSACTVWQNADYGPVSISIPVKLPRPAFKLHFLYFDTRDEDHVTMYDIDELQGTGYSIMRINVERDSDMSNFGVRIILPSTSPLTLFRPLDWDSASNTTCMDDIFVYFTNETSMICSRNDKVNHVWRIAVVAAAVIFVTPPILYLLLSWLRRRYCVQ